MCFNGSINSLTTRSGKDSDILLHRATKIQLESLSQQQPQHQQQPATPQQSQEDPLILIYRFLCLKNLFWT